MSNIGMENEGQGKSDASGDAGSSRVPGLEPGKRSEGLEDSLPDSGHPTSSGSNQSTNKSHAKGDGEASVVPQKLQEKLPEGVERAVPNALHDTGDSSGLHRK